MAERLVTIATFNELTEAHIIKGRLEAEGILCFLGDEHIVGVQPFYSVAVGGVKLKVTENDAEEARAILLQIQGGTGQFILDDTVELAEPVHEEEKITCPNCGSDHVAEEKFSKGVFSYSILLLGFPLPFLSHKYKCYECSYQWKAKPAATN